ncbi:MAG: DNA polymerase III subunit gamma/tau [Candidatus Aminicenantes bacterium]
MSYKIFALKYRPQTFEEVVGQKSVVRTIQNAISTGRVAQAYLFSGMRGTGKTTVARILAKALNCVNGPTPNPCNACKFCQDIFEEKAIDVLEIDGASNRQVDDIEPIRETVKYKPVYTRFKVLIIDEVHMLSTHAFNALLKTLEEPPPNTVFIFATTEFDKVPATIVSRCQHFEFKKISHRDIINHLMEITRKEGITVSPAGLAMIAEAADGSMRDAQSLLDQAVAFSGEQIGDEDLRTILGVIGQDLLFGISTAVLEERPEDIFGLVESVISGGHDLRSFFGKLVEHFRALLLVRSVKKPEDLLPASPDELQALRAQADKVTPEDLLRYLIALQQAEPGLKYSAVPRIYMETFLIRLCHFRKIVPLQDLIRDVESLKRTEAGTPGRPAAAGPAPARVSAPPPPPTPAGPRPSPAPQKDLFARVLERLAVDRAPLAALLSQYSSVRVRDDALEVLFDRGKGFFATSIQEKDLKAVERTLAEVAGRKMAVRFAERDPESVPPAAPGREIETALKDPAVQFFMNTFKAQVLAADPIRDPRDKDPKRTPPTEEES